jgi:hypothetical protein
VAAISELQVQGRYAAGAVATRQGVAGAAFCTAAIAAARTHAIGAARTLVGANVTAAGAAGVTAPARSNLKVRIAATALGFQPAETPQTLKMAFQAGPCTIVVGGLTHRTGRPRNGAAFLAAQGAAHGVEVDVAEVTAETGGAGGDAGEAGRLAAHPA